VMGATTSAPEPQVDVDLSKHDLKNDMELSLIQQQIDNLFRFKVLLLGAGESGKSTVVKQLRLLHNAVLSDRELSITANSLHQNVVDCMKALLSARKKLNLPALSSQDEKTEVDINAWDASEGTTDGKVGIEHDTLAKRLSPELGKRIIALFNSPSIQKAYARRSEFWLLDSFPYFMDNLERFCSSNWVPSDDDSVMARVKTTGIVTIEIDHEIEQKQDQDPKFLRFQVVDVGGQRNERKKWIHCFDDVKAILYCDNLAGYNQVLYEDSSKNRMIESLEIFSKLTHNKLFEKTPIFLFLNKRDLFEKMVTEVDMKVTFPDYKGGKDYKAAMDYIQTNFFKASSFIP